MVELVPTPFPDLVERLCLEPRVNGALFDLPIDKWYVPDAAAPDLSVRFHDQSAANPAGPASGPHTQLAQNLVLSYLAGGRILELKTVQIKDRLTIPRPCIDMTNVGYNVEWSQELRIAESLNEYVSGMMLIHMLRNGPLGDGWSGWPSASALGDRFLPAADLSGPLGAVVYDISLGYDLAGISSRPIREFIEGLLDCSALVDSLRMQIPARHAGLADLDYPRQVSNSVTLSTFHGCPADEIEGIARFLIDEYDLDVIVKMNPPMLGRDRMEHLLHDVLGYTEVAVRPEAYTGGLTLEDGVALCRTLADHAAARGRRFGAKFSNTLEVLNHRDFFTPENRVMYLSGPPLYVITLTLVDEFRRAIGPHLPISYSAGIDRRNFPEAVACGMVPVSACTDLLKPGGYARLPKYLHALAERMVQLGAGTIDDYISKTAAATGGPTSSVADAAVHNTTVAAARSDPRYRSPHNRAVPKRIESHLETFDCLTCDKCVPVCPNDANFSYPAAARAIECRDYLIAPDGRFEPAGEARVLRIRQGHQIANYADSCNECGNCDTFCPEYGRPFIAKPTFFGTREGFEQHPQRDGFYVERNGSVSRISARYQTGRYTLTRNQTTGQSVFCDGTVTATFDANHHLSAVEFASAPPPQPHRLDMHVYHTLVILLDAILDPARVNPINVRLAALQGSA